MRWALVALAACGGRSQVSEAKQPPNLDELRALLAPHAGYRTTERGCPADQTLGEYVGMLVKYGEPSADGDIHKLTGGCRASFPQEPVGIDPPRDDRYWYCVIDSYTSDPAGDSPWHYELRLRVRRADGQVDLTTLACPGGA